MASPSPTTQRILGEVARLHGCDMDQLAQNLPDLSWNQVFLEIDRLSREGEVLVTFATRGRYIIQLPSHKHAPDNQAHH